MEKKGWITLIVGSVLFVICGFIIASAIRKDGGCCG